MDALNLSPHLSPKVSKTYPHEFCSDSITSIFTLKFVSLFFLISPLPFLLEENPKSDDEEDLEIIVVSPSPRKHSADSTSTLPYSYGQAVFPTSSPISSTTTTSLPMPSSQDSFKSLSSSSFHFPFHSTMHSSSISLSNPPSYSDSLFSFSTHASVVNPSLSLSYTLTSSSPSSLSLSLSLTIYRPLPIYALPRTTNSSMESIPCLYSSVFSTNTLSMSHHGGFSTMVSSRPIPCHSKRRVTRRVTRNWPRDNTFYTTRRQCPRPAAPCSSLSSNTVLFPLLSSWANPTSYHYSDGPMDLTFKPRTSLQTSGGSPSNPLFISNSSHPHIYSLMVTFNEPSENVRGMFSFVHSCQFSPGANNKLLLSSLISR